MVETLKAIFLGIVQGLTEFLPVSSSAHLNIFPWLFNWEIESMDFALHTGTLLAILVYFFKDWIAIICGGYKAAVKRENTVEGRIFWYLVIATIPAGLIGMLLEKIVDGALEGKANVEMIVISLALIIMGVVLYIVDKNAKSTVPFKKINFKQAMAIGLSQIIAAALPGVSRSGITMTVSRSLGVDRESSAKFSFFLSAPIIAGGVIYTLLFNPEEFNFGLPLLFGVIASFISGLFVIKFLLAFLKKGSYKAFAIYRIVFGVIIIAIALIRM